MPSSPSSAERIVALARRYPEGVHHLRPPAAVVDGALPRPLVEVYLAFDGAELFYETIVLVPSAEIVREHGRARVGTVGGDDIAVDLETGAVWRHEEDTGEELPEGTAFDRWLLGAFEAEALLYDAEGEFAEVFAESGELLGDIAIRRERALLKRDKKAPAPRWRLARALVVAGDHDAAAGELEEVVRVAPEFAWAWYDLARIAERRGDPAAAADDMAEAGAARPGYEHAGFFWAHAARLAAAAGDEPRRAEYAARARDADPAIARAQRDGAEASFRAGDLDAALELVLAALAVEPRDAMALDLARRIRAARDEDA